MRNKKIIFIALLLFTFVIKAQNYDQEGYEELTHKEYIELIEGNKENKLNGKYYVREFKDEKIVALHRIEFQKGKKQGEWLHFKIFRQKGTLDLSTIENYDDDERNGYYYNSDNGFTFTEKGIYEKGKKEGLWSFTKGDSNEKINYKNDEKHGEYWHQDGSGVIIKGSYKKGEKLDNWTIKDLDGNTSPLVKDAPPVKPDPKTPLDTDTLETITGTIQKPDGTIAPIAVVRLQLSDTSCAYAFTDFDGNFSMEINKKKITPSSFFEIVIEGFPKKIISFSRYSSQKTIVLDDGSTKITYDEYRAFYESMGSCSL